MWRHNVGTPQRDDELVYEEKDDTFYLSVHKTTSEHFVLIALHSTTTTEIHLLDAEYADARPRVFVPRRKGHEYTLDHYDHRFWLRSNRDGKTSVSTAPAIWMSRAGKPLSRRAIMW